MPQQKTSREALVERMDIPPDPPPKDDRDQRIDAAWRRYWQDGDKTDLIALGIMTGQPASL